MGASLNCDWAHGIWNTLYLRVRIRDPYAYARNKGLQI